MTPALKFISHQTWAIHPPIFQSLAAILEDRANGKPAAYDDGGRAPKHAGEPAIEIIGSRAVIPVRGVIARYADQINGACQDTGRSAESLQRDLMAAAADPRVSEIIMRLDSPGGTVAGTAETGDVVRAIVASGKPVTAFVDGMAASAAYWLASQASRIVMAGPTSEVGSIGVITAHVDASRAQEKQGYKVTVFRTSPLKAPGAMGESLTPEQARAIDRDLTDFHAVFSDAVRDGRKLNDEQIAAATTGEMWRPAQAIAMGLADAVMPWESLIGGETATKNKAPAIAAATNSTSKKAEAMPDSILDLIEASPKHAGVIAKLGKEGKQAPEIAAHLADLDRAAALADLSAKADASEKAAAELAEKIAAAEKSHKEAMAGKEAEIVALNARIAQLTNSGKVPHVAPDPKGGSEPVARSAMSREDKAAYVKAHGKEKYLALPF